MRPLASFFGNFGLPTFLRFGISESLNDGCSLLLFVVTQREERATQQRDVSVCLGHLCDASRRRLLLLLRVPQYQKLRLRLPKPFFPETSLSQVRFQRA